MRKIEIFIINEQRLVQGRLASDTNTKE
ncbi:uncharacterized protein METZ01_LOCUS197471 [marine metagenome]|uniref:Uncharacterized protein n=1 Tax=marine metagenome TaxID=408172 RepID=A0A382E425_9ZZZZ